MDPNSRPILLALLAVVIFTVLALAASLVIPFDVTTPALVDILAGQAERRISGQTPDLLGPDDQTRLGAGHSLRVLPSGEVRITFEINGGWAVASGPATIVHVESYRRATVLGHLSDRFEREHVLTLQQSEGTVRYNFAHTDPAFAASQITVRLPDRHYTPEIPCWTIEINSARESRIEPDACSP